MEKKGLYTFYRSRNLLALFFILLLADSFSQDDLQKIIRLNKISDSIVHVDMIAAKKAANEALDLAIKIKNDSMQYTSRLSRGIADYYLGNLNACQEDFIKNKDLAKKLNSPKKIIESLNAIANVYKQTEKYDLALQTYNEALDVCSVTGNDSKSFLIMSNIAMVFNLQQKNDSAIAITNKIIRSMQRHKKEDKHFLSGLYGVLMSSYIDIGNVDSVEKYGAVAVRLKEELGEKMNYAGYLYNLSNFYIMKDDFKKAAESSSKALATNPDNIELLRDLKYQLGTAFYELKDFKNAAEMFHDCSKLNDSINKIQNIEKLNEMEVKYETGKKEEELKRLGAEKEVADLKAKQSRLWLIASSVGILSVVIVVIVLLQQNKKRKEANKLLLQQNNEIVHQKKEITDSINYAKRIQLAILPPDKMVRKLLPNAFVLYKPKDVVSGDFYWMEEKNGMTMFAAVDCTGHGVPGAMMSVVGLNLLNQAVKEKGLTVPAEILQHLDKGVTDTLRQTADTDSIKDGMDLSLCAYNPKTLELQYAGAFNNLWVVRNNITSTYTPVTKNEIFFEEHLLEIKADKFPIGSNLDGIADNYTNYKLQLQKGDCVYLYSDGFADQFGGPKGKKFKYNALKKLLISVRHLSPSEQRQKLLSAFEEWRGNLEQVDDILVIGVVV